MPKSMYVSLLSFVTPLRHESLNLWVLFRALSASQQEHIIYV